MYVVVVALPAFQSDFDVLRGTASFPYTILMMGFGFGGLLAAKLAARYGLIKMLLFSSIALGLSYLQAALSTSLLLLNLAHFQIGVFGLAMVFTPLLADISKWFLHRRGLAIAICACGNYLAGTVWPPLIQMMIIDSGWRHAYIVVGLLSTTLMIPLLLVLRRRIDNFGMVENSEGSMGGSIRLGLSSRSLMLILCVAGIACCVAMAMPQVHIVALCGDRGYGLSKGAEMLSVMLACGVISRLGFGWLSDRIGGLATLLIGASLQCFALACYLGADTLPSVYAVSIMFGLFQGGIVPCYALIVREFFPEAEAGRRLSIIILATVIGMAFGGWAGGVIYDFTGSYETAFIHSVGWNVLNMGLIGFLLIRLNFDTARVDTTS
jgi:MFS family permease